MKLLGGKRSRSGNLTLDHILGHALSFNRHISDRRLYLATSLRL